MEERTLSWTVKQSGLKVSRKKFIVPGFAIFAKNLSMNIPCHIEPCEVINVIGGGLLVAATFAIIYDWLKARRFRIHYGIIAGRRGTVPGMFDGFTVAKNGKHISNASIIYVAENKLEIQVATLDNNEVWKGFISIYSGLGQDTDVYGKLDFLITHPENKIGIMGSKIIRIFDRNSFVLIHKAGEGYGKEFFYRNSIPEESFFQYHWRILTNRINQNRINKMLKKKKNA